MATLAKITIFFLFLKCKNVLYDPNFFKKKIKKKFHINKIEIDVGDACKIGGLVSISIRWVANELDLKVPTTCRVGSCVMLQKKKGKKKEDVNW